MQTKEHCLIRGLRRVAQIRQQQQENPARIPLSLGASAGRADIVEPLSHLPNIESPQAMAINHVDKTDFLQIYKQIQPQTFTTSNIGSSFSASGLVPYNPTRVLEGLLIYSTPTSPGSFYSKSSSSWTAEP